MNDKIKRAAQREAEAWHDLCGILHIYQSDVPAWRKLKNKWEVAREHLADAMRLRGADRYRPRLLLSSLGESLEARDE
jgi:hypothetical protein